MDKRSPPHSHHFIDGCDGYDEGEEDDEEDSELEQAIDVDSQDPQSKVGSKDEDEYETPIVESPPVEPSLRKV